MIYQPQGSFTMPSSEPGKSHIVVSITGSFFIHHHPASSEPAKGRKRHGTNSTAATLKLPQHKHASIIVVETSPCFALPACTCLLKTQSFRLSALSIQGPGRKARKKKTFLGSRTRLRLAGLVGIMLQGCAFSFRVNSQL